MQQILISLSQAGMLANYEVDSSSSSDDDEVRRLKEAVISFENVPKSYHNGSSQPKSDNVHLNKKLSKRKNLSTDDTKINELNTTPEFRFFVAKKLGSYLDSVTEYPEKKNIENDDKIPKPDSFRLFSESNGDWLTEDEVEKRSCVKRKKRRKSSSSDSGEDERLMEAVIPDDFLRDIVKRVAEHAPSEKETFRSDKQSELPSEETDQCMNKKHKKCKHKNKDKEDSQDSVSQDVQQDLIEKRKHKKKKKKQKSCVE